LPFVAAALYGSYDVEGVAHGELIVRFVFDRVLIPNNEVVLALRQRCHVDQAEVFALLTDGDFFLQVIAVDSEVKAH
jgi:hypothetical protein